MITLEHWLYDHTRTLTVWSHQNVDCTITLERWLYDHTRTLTVWSHQNVDCMITPERWLYDHTRTLTVWSHQNVECTITLERTLTVPQPVHITMLFPECRRSTRDTFCQDAVTLELAENGVSCLTWKVWLGQTRASFILTLAWPHPILQKRVGVW